MRKSAFYKDIFRTLRNNLSRFIAIVVMTALGTGVFTGFAAGCMDVFDSADHFYDRQNTYDIKIASTLGLTQEDLTAVAALDKVDSVYGDYSMDVMVPQKDGKQLLANATTLDPGGMNAPYILEGTLPTKQGQLAVTTKFIQDTGLSIGDTITLNEVDTEKSTNGAKTNAEAEKTTDTMSSVGTKEASGTKDTTKSSVSVNTEEVDLGLSNEEDTSGPTLAVAEYVITAIVISPLNISNTGGTFAAVSISSGSSDVRLYVTKDCIDSEVYTSLYATLEGAKELGCYSDPYRSLVETMTATIEDTLKKEREQARYDAIVGDANAKIADAEQVLADKMAEAEAEFTKAQKKIDDGWVSYNDGLAELQTNQKKLTDGQEALDQGKKTAEDKFTAAQQEIDAKAKELKAGEEKLNTQEKDTIKTFAGYEQQLSDSQKELDQKQSQAKAQLAGAVAALSPEAQELWSKEESKKIWADMVSDGVSAAPYLLASQQGEKPSEELTKSYNTAMNKLQSDTQALAVSFATGGAPLSKEQTKSFSGLAVNEGTLQYSQTVLDQKSSALAAQKADATKQLADARRKLEDGKTKLAAGQKELDRNRSTTERQLATKQAELIDGIDQLKDGKKKLEDAATDLKDGQKELDLNRAEYEETIASAKQKLTDAKEDVAGINMAKWYVWDRSENDSFDGLYNDTSFIQAVTQAFPLIFFLVAILVSLTTMTRMVEEDRTLIGTYKSLGYSKLQISMKYLLYAVLAVIAGGILGTVVGFYILPKVISIIMKTMYVLPMYQFNFYPGYGMGGFGAFAVGIVGATVFACAEMLHKRPAELMRPKAPKEGSRIWLERIPFIWKRLKFLNKVTCRNLFRYKKRALMTIIGILGCTMLIVFGFGIRDTVGSLMADQYDKVTVYDGIVVTDNLSAEEMKQLAGEMKQSGQVKELQQMQISTLTLGKGKDNLDITVIVIPDKADLDSYIHLRNVKTKHKKSLTTEGIVVTQNAARQLKLAGGDTVSLQNEDNLEYKFPIEFVTVNNAGNFVYIRESTYQAAFGNYAGTSFLLKLNNTDDSEKWLDSLKDDDRILSVNSSQEARETFGDANKIINMVVYLLISMSAVLALTVLFTLSNINVSERERELATIKVLGFRRQEVYSYVNKETLILTMIGILLGLPTGYGITNAILSSVSIADIAFHVRVSASAYLIAAILTLVFTLLVNLVTNKALRKIDMVGALKSVE